MTSETMYRAMDRPVGLPPLFRLFIGVAVVILIPALLLFAALIGGRILLHHHIAAIRASGEPTTLQELAEKYPPLPEAQNMAVPLMQSQKYFTHINFEAFYKENTQQSPETEEAAQLRRSLFFNRVSNACSGEVPPFKPLDHDVKSLLTQHLSQNQECLAFFHEAARRPECRFSVEQFPSFYSLELLIEEYMVNTDDGNAEKAFQSITDYLQIALCMEKDPVLAYKDYGLALYCMRNKLKAAIQYGLSRSLFNAPQVQTLSALLGQFSNIKPFERSARANRLDFLDTYHQFQTNEYDRLIEKRDLRETKEGLQRQFAQLCENPFRINKQITLLDEAIRYAHQNPDIAPGAWKMHQDMQKEVLDFGLNPHPSSRILNESISKLPLTLTTTALALYRYHQDKNTWPGTLTELVPEYLPAVPMDPYRSPSQTPLQYLNGPAGVRVYSVYEDSQDDKGKTSLECEAENNAKVRETPTQAQTVGRRRPIGDINSPQYDLAFVLQPASS